MKYNDEDLYKMIFRCSHVFRHQSGGRIGQSRILSILYQKGKMTQRELLELLDIQAGSLSEILSKIEDEGWIRRTPHCENKRCVDVELTSKGKKQAVIFIKQRQEMMQKLFEGLEEKEKDELGGLLEKLIDSWHTDSFCHKKCRN